MNNAFVRKFRTLSMGLSLWLSLALISPSLALAAPNANQKSSRRAKVYDVVGIQCASGFKPDMDRVYVAGAVNKIGTDAVQAFTKAPPSQTFVVLRYPIAEGVTDSAPPPCPAGDVLMVTLKKNDAMMNYAQNQPLPSEDDQLPE